MPLLDTLPSSGAETFTSCPLCGTELDGAHPTECSRCDWVLGYRRQQDRAHHLGTARDTIALVLSVAPGAGHIYKGYRLAGAVVMAAALFVLLFVLATVSATAGGAILLVPIFWSAVMLHAYWADDLAAPLALAPAIRVPIFPSK